MTEIWKIIDEFPNYLVSNLGKVKNIRNEQIMNEGFSDGYARVHLTNSKGHKRPYVHKLVFFAFISDVLNNKSIDHINRNKTDNRAENLRLANFSQQGLNKDKKTGCTSNFKGVSKHSNKWIAAISINKKPVYLGSFDFENEAALMYNWFAIKLYKDFAVINPNVKGFYTQELSQKIMKILEKQKIK